MPNRSTESKQRWNSENYVQIKVSIKPETANGFKTACATAGVSMAGVLSKFMADYSKTPIKKKPPTDPYSTRRKRRGVISAIITQMEQLALAEESYRDRIPENLQNSITYETADQSAATLSEIVDLLREVY